MLLVALFLGGPHVLLGEPSAAATAAFNAYSQALEARLERQHGSAQGFLAGTDVEARARRGELVIEELTPPGSDNIACGMLHHWRGTAFVSGARAADFERLLRDFDGYPRTFAPQVLRAGVRSSDGDHLQTTMRVRQKHVITVVLDTDYDVHFGQLDAADGYSVSRSTRITEIEGAGTHNERALPSSEEHGFLWRLNSYWSYEERDGGLYLQIEAVSLTRAVPAGLGWAIGPFVKSIPRESLEFTLQSACAALRKRGSGI